MILEMIILNTIDITDDHIDSNYLNSDYLNYDHFDFNHVDSSINKVILSNDIIIHQFNEKAIEVFRDLVNDYFTLFINIDFVDLSEKN